MSNPARLSSFRSAANFVFACALALAGVALSPSAHAAPQNLGANAGQVVGIEFDGRSVSNLDKSVEFYKLLGFTEVPGLDKSWRNDPVMNQIHGTKGVESRMAKFTMNTNMGEQTPFTLYLREFRGIKRRNVMAGKTPWEPGSTHMEVVVPDVDKTWSVLKAANLLFPCTWDGKLIALPGQTKGSMAYITDPDGMDIELIEQRPAVPAANGRPARPADPPGINHVGLIILDPDKAEGFYGSLLGAQMPAAPTQWLSGDFMDSAVGGHGNILRMYNGSYALAADRDARMRFEIIEYENRKKPVAPYDITDIGVNWIGLEVTDIDDLLVRLKGAGVQVVSNGIAEMKGGYRVALVRDPDVHAFVELYEPPKKQ
ncbi:MAG TPA: VOC family protein [Candidatus Baltobacteraceae bacterium]|nr:VOC family protein [Candidatus Baltobacteraceae bacterium]